MKKIVKRLLIFMALCLVFVTVFALSSCSSDKKIDGVLYQLDFGGTYYILQDGSECEVDNLVIPADIEGTPVKQIQSNAFYQNAKIKSVTIPAGVELVKTGAFYGCTALESVTLSNTAVLENYTFKRCTALKTINFPTDWTVDEEGFCIPEEAFYGCSALTELTIDGDVSKIGYRAFGECGITKLVLGEGVKEIGGGAFYSCAFLAEITLPASLETLNMGMFEKCENLKKVNVTDLAAWCGVSYYNNNYSDGPFCYNADLYVDGEKIVDLVIPKEVEVISNYVFWGANIKTVTFEEGSTLKQVKDSAFRSCPNLESVDFPQSLELIETENFRNCEKLEAVNLPLGNWKYEFMNSKYALKDKDNPTALAEWFRTQYSYYEEVFVEKN